MLKDSQRKLPMMMILSLATSSKVHCPRSLKSRSSINASFVALGVCMGLLLSLLRNLNVSFLEVNTAQLISSKSFLGEMQEKQHLRKLHAYRNTETVEDDKVTKVIIVSYRRSGSSLVGDMFNNNPRSFYLFEPENGVAFFPERFTGDYKMYDETDKEEEDNFDRFRQKYARMWELMVKLPEIIDEMLDCQLQNLNASFFTTDFLRKSKSLNEFGYCLGSDVTRSSKCRHLVEESCKLSKIRAVKLVWLNMTDIVPLLSIDPSIKVIHLIRDPRAILLSRFKNFFFPNSNFRSNTQALAEHAFYLCGGMFQNIQVASDLDRIYPNRVRTLYYEDIVRDIAKSARNIYHFLGDKTPKEMEPWLSLNGVKRKKENLDEWEFGTIRSNPIEVSEAWRKNVTDRDMRLVDIYCSDVYATSRYKPMSPKNYRINLIR